MTFKTNRFVILPLFLAFVAADSKVISAQTLLQRCLGVSPGREPVRPVGPSPATMSYCQQLPGWSLYEQAGQRFQAGDHGGAARLAMQAAQAGNPVAQSRLATLFAKGDGVPVNAAAALHWMKVAASEGGRSPKTSLVSSTNTVDPAAMRATAWRMTGIWRRNSGKLAHLKVCPPANSAWAALTSMELECRSTAKTRCIGTTRRPRKATPRGRISPSTCATITVLTAAAATTTSARCWDH